MALANMLQALSFSRRCLDAEEMRENENTEPKPANYIDNLHEIFFVQIFEQIEDLGDQVRMARAYPQFLSEIIKVWKKRFHLRIIGPHMPFICILGFEDYVFFMRHMADYFTDLHIQENYISCFPEFYHYIRHLSTMHIARFEKLENCILAGIPNTIVNDDIRDLSFMLPNLKRLMCSMNISGAYITNFKKLEHLVLKSLFQSVPLESRWIQEICLYMPQLRVLDITDYFDSNVQLYAIQLPNLEVLKLNLSTVENILPEVLQLPKLRKLAIRYDDSRHPEAEQETIFQQIIDAKRERITRIALNNKVVQLPQRWKESLATPLKLPKLRSLICSNWTHDELFLNRHQIPCAQMLRLCFTGWEILRENQLLELVTDCTQLNFLGLNGYNSTVDKLRKLAYIRYRECNKKPLRICSDDMWCNLSPDDLKYWTRKDKYIRIICDGTHYDYREDGFELDFA